MTRVCLCAMVSYIVLTLDLDARYIWTTRLLFRFLGSAYKHEQRIATFSGMRHTDITFHEARIMSVKEEMGLAVVTGAVNGHGKLEVPAGHCCTHSTPYSQRSRRHLKLPQSLTCAAVPILTHGAS